MKRLTISIGLLGMAALLIGWLGTFLLQGALDRRVEACFARELVSIVAIVERSQWHQPWESDPAWGKLEESLGVDILPVRLPRGFVDGQAPEWSVAGFGPRRITAMASLAVESSGSVEERLGVRVTREVDTGWLLQQWLFCWAGMCGLGIAFAVQALSVVRRDQHEHQHLLDPWVRAMRAGKPTSQPAKLVSGKGGPTDEAWLPKIDTDSNLEAALSVLGDSINRVLKDLQSENDRAELVLGNLQEGVLAIDDRSQVLLANNALQRLLELPAESYLDRLLLEVVRVPLVNELAWRVLEQSIPCEELVELSRPQRVLRVLGRPLPLGGGRSGVLLTVRDETVFRRIESLRRDFVANASHELKTPLAAIRAFAETLQLGALDDRPAAEQFVGGIIEQADRINGLVQGMLQLSRVEAGTALKIENFDAGEAAEPCIAAAQAMARSKGITIDAHFPETPLEIRCDRDGFQTILSNLLSNAVRYTPDGGRVAITLEGVQGECRLRVSDTGIGMHADDLERVFERFYRAEKDRSSDTGGTGLGLSIVKHLTQALGGSVTASSRPGQGSCFEVVLPMAHKR